uniref:Uncharacterized protein n=1 Tax=Mycena chlorophos TaxID=658473 RepID=A0ABQ0M1L2_MYCCL|nr:predicted protein [Mycena chlorophos]
MSSSMAKLIARQSSLPPVRRGSLPSSSASTETLDPTSAQLEPWVRSRDIFQKDLQEARACLTLGGISLAYDARRETRTNAAYIQLPPGKFGNSNSRNGSILWTPEVPSGASPGRIANAKRVSARLDRATGPRQRPLLERASFFYATEVVHD